MYTKDKLLQYIVDNGQEKIHLEYTVQEQPISLEAFIIGVNFTSDDCVALALDDNIFYGQSFSKVLRAMISRYYV